MHVSMQCISIHYVYIHMLRFVGVNIFSVCYIFVEDVTIACACMYSCTVYAH